MRSQQTCALSTCHGAGIAFIKRHTFGIKSASEVFHCLNSESFGNIEDAFMVADDMIRAVATKAEHDAILEKLMNTAESLNVKFNKDKLQYTSNDVTRPRHYIGWSET